MAKFIIVILLWFVRLVWEKKKKKKKGQRERIKSAFIWIERRIIESEGEWEVYIRCDKKN